MSVRRYKTYQQVVPAGDSIVLDVPGQFVRCLYASGLILLAIEDEVQGDFPQGLAYTMPGDSVFSRLRLINTSGAPVTVQLGVGFGRLDDSRSTVTAAVTVALGTNIQTGVVSVSTAATLIVPAQASRRVATVFNTDGTKYLYLGGPGVTTANGFYIPPFSYWEFKGTTAAIYGIAGTGTIASRFVEEY